MVAWDTVITPRMNGGLGVRDLKAHNMAMICKLMSNILQHSNVPCFNWFITQYGHREISTLRHSRDTNMWKCLKSSMHLVLHSTQCKLGDGTRISFWFDHWLQCGRLRFAFPVLFSFASSKHCTVASQFRDAQWALHLRPNLSNTASRELGDLLDILQYSQTLFREIPELPQRRTESSRPNTSIS